MKTIVVSDEVHDQLMLMAAQMKVQSNRCTEHPLYCVYQKREVLVPEGHGDHEGWVDEGGEKISDKAVAEYVERWRKDNPEEAAGKTDDDIAVDELKFSRYAYNIEDVPVGGQVYMTEMGAQDHIDRNHYHYKSPFVFVESAWRNREMQALRTFLLGLVK